MVQDALRQKCGQGATMAGNAVMSALRDIAAVATRRQHADTVAGTPEEGRNRDEKWLATRGRCSQ